MSRSSRLNEVVESLEHSLGKDPYSQSICAEATEFK